MRDHLPHRHLLVRQEAAEPDLLRPAIGQLAQANALPLVHAPYHQRPVAGQTLIAKLANLRHRLRPRLHDARASTSHTRPAGRNTAVATDSLCDVSIRKLRNTVVFDSFISPSTRSPATTRGSSDHPHRNICAQASPPGEGSFLAICDSPAPPGPSEGRRMP